MFFAAGSVPFEDRGNRSALAEAGSTVWPVLLTWTHLGAGGQVHDSAGWLSCVTAGGVIGDPVPGTSSRFAGGVSVLQWAVAVAAAAASLVMVV